MTFKDMIRTDLRNVIFNTSEFGTVATIGSATVNGNFKNRFIAVNGVESLMPTFECVDEDAAGVTHSSTVTIGSTTYKVIGIQPNTYTTLLILSRD